jgi:putative protease
MASKKKAKKPVKKSIKKKSAPKKIKKRPSVKKGLKKPAKKPLAKKKSNLKKTKKPKENSIGIITHYFPHVQAAVIKLKAPLSVGETIKVKGHTTDFTQTITSMQIDRVPVNSAKTGQEIGVLVNSRVRQHDSVYKI